MLVQGTFLHYTPACQCLLTVCYLPSAPSLFPMLQHKNTSWSFIQLDEKWERHISIGEDSFVYRWPAYRESWIVPAYATGILRSEDLGNMIKYFGIVGEGLKTMRKPLWNIKDVAVF